MICDECKQDATKTGLVIYQRRVICRACRDLARGDAGNPAASVIGDDIPGGFVQEHFGHKPEVFYSKKAMLKRAKELGLEPFVRHTDGDKHTTRWI